MLATLALVLVVLVTLLVIAVILGGDTSVTLDVVGVEIEATAVGLFLTGLIAGVVVTLAALMLRIGLRGMLRRRQRMRELERRARDAEAAHPTADDTSHGETSSHRAPEPDSESAESAPLAESTDTTEPSESPGAGGDTHPEPHTSEDSERL